MTAYPGMEAITVARWVWETLTTDATLQGLLGGSQAALERLVADGTYDGDADKWVTFDVLPPLDVKGVGMVQIMSQVQFQVKVTAKGSSYGPCVPIYERVHTLLEGRLNQVPSAGEGLVLTAQRVSGIRLPERADGIEYRHLGGTYETLTQ